MNDENTCFIAGLEYENLKQNIPEKGSNLEKLTWILRMHRVEGSKRICIGKSNDDLEGKKMANELINNITKDITLKRVD